MADTFVVCAVLKPGDNDVARREELTKLVDIFRNGGGATQVISNGRGVAMLSFADGAKASQSANDLLVKALDAEVRGLSLEPISVSVDAGSDVDASTLTVSAQQLANIQNEPNQIVITHSAYERLDGDERRAYKVEEQLDGLRVHRRFGSGSESCFVISPIGDPDSTLRKRADFVIEEYVKRACSELNLSPYRSDQKPSARIRRDMMSSVLQAKVVVAYLGSPRWNPNVMLELGYRIVAGGPLVILRDSIQDAEKDEPLPFDIGDMQVVSLPPQAADSDRVRRERASDEIANAIRQAMKQAGTLRASHPFMQVEIDRGIAKNHLVRQATAATATLLAHKGSLVGAKVTAVMRRVMSMMSDTQAKAFEVDQTDLLIRLAGGDTFGQEDGGVSSVTARIPMVFETHPDSRHDQKAYLPIIVRYDGGADDDRLLLNIIYMDVTSATRINEKNVFECRLEGTDRSMLLWDNYAVSYDKILTTLPIYNDAIQRHVEALKPDRYKRILDIGCGTGNVAIRMAALDKHVMGVDRSEAMLLLLRSKLTKMEAAGVTIYEQSAESLPFRDEWFDAVTILLALFAMEDKAGAALDEAIRVLKPGGLLVVTEPKQTFQLQPLLDYAEDELIKQKLFKQYALDWRRVSAVNKRIDPAARLHLPTEDITGILSNRGFVNITHTNSHLGHCETITAEKPS